MISNSDFIGFRDKGISVGERSNLIIHSSKLHNNNIGVAVKDSSHAFFIDVDYNNNSKDISVYRKKRIFGGGYAYIEPTEFDINKITMDADRQSRIFKLDRQASLPALISNPKNVNLDLPVK